ncbi:16S rRNA (adenine(1518)-N(6)/adenine(1519)-N(6))-dimethyltransferase RsmA [Aestuariirhabdus sp. Z084]|uniref:16S rRNA (adenine(1518)-N(6)/adenine(1519)-N(6))- dimethyltransferase RsmA n=1 Tax=Aestuariirhabdus haliotis TaxID=2918751 RepID=UPI00201B3A55|nr:16S rRNA (adenine(1518)-N(6)/adenine(1519)-N(6))-dimethyltransferase RsmA [Aestuariirhabdus haliotis]MCL6415411.1 16S rRNA (adenine(1518)-N(6)/adenine(1519)-N(6))-dimethyltransferase RsmA [Aestuariirhabdus haliotis]MCL6419167.1 16S rRNA (adenine(1518)-N(6)/adenine(1519)-N(6))-dimethyltransferase RsmA [Aestuariirhabdus haliotis]
MSQKSPFEHRARKRFGQNFLHDAGVINRIIRAIAPKSSDHLVEIGPGQGALTRDLVDSGARLDVVELDQDLVPLLLANFSLKDNFHLHQGDALRFDFSQLQQQGEKLRVIGNLPYNISTPLMFHLLSYQDLIEDMHFMLQKEVVDRLAAGPGDKHYGRLGIMVQYYCQVDSLFPVGSGAFNPAPKVESAIVRLRPYKERPHMAQDVKQLETVVRTAFTQRRKTLRNALKSLITADSIESLGIDAASRPERITLAEFVAISDHISNNPTEP